MPFYARTYDAYGNRTFYRIEDEDGGSHRWTVLPDEAAIPIFERANALRAQTVGSGWDQPQDMVSTPKANP